MSRFILIAAALACSLRNGCGTIASIASTASTAPIAPIAPIAPAAPAAPAAPQNVESLDADHPMRSEEVFNLAPEVILAADEGAAGTNTLSKDFVGRALFNCVVLGERIAVSPEAAKTLLEEKKQRPK